MATMEFGRQPVKVDGAMKYFNEYLYYRVIQYVNSNARADGGATIKKRQAIQLRDNLTRALADREKTISSAGKQVFGECMNKVLPKEHMRAMVANGFNYKEFYAKALSEFSTLTGMQAASGFGVGRGNAQVTALPLSPYDPQFSMRETFLEHGTNLLYASADSINFRSGGKLSPANAASVFDSGLTLYEGVNGDIQAGQREAGQALSMGDMSGYSLLSTLVSERNAREVRAFVNQDDNPNPVYSDPAEVRKAYQVLSALRDEGISFEFKRDERPGQLKAKVRMTGMPPVDVRVLDPYNPLYGGCSRVYYEGIQGYYSTDKQERKMNDATGKTENTYAGYVPTVQERIDLIKFALGQPVLRKDGKPVGSPGTYQTMKGGVNESYHSGKSFSAMVHPFPNDRYAKVFLRLSSMRPSEGVRLRNMEDADNYLMAAVDSARENFSKQMDVDRLIQEAEDAKASGHEDYMPQFHIDPAIAAVQERYWSVLMGSDVELLQAGSTESDYENAMDTLDESGLGGTGLESWLLKGMVYEGTPEEKVRKHFDDLLEERIGSMAPDLDGKRFDPVSVAKYMTSAYGQYRNSADIVTALRVSGIKASELRGDAFYNQTIADKLIEFDQSTARQLRFDKDPFMQGMYDAVKDAVESNGCQISDSDILIDANGIIEYRATKFTTKGSTAKGRKDIVGHVGQVFAPDERGLITTRFAGSPNFTFCPAMVADVVPNKAGENLPYEQRVRIKTYQASMEEGIRFRIRDDLMSEWGEVGETTSLNNIPRRNQGVRFEAGELESKPEELRKAIIAAETNRVVFSREITGNAGRYDLYKFHHDESRDPDDDVHVDAIQLMGGENYALLRPKESAGIFDPRATGTGPAQGSRYLVDGAHVARDGHIEPARKDDGTIDADARNGLSRYIDARMGEFDAIDRYDMTVTALRHCQTVTPAHVAQTTFGGWGFGDAVVVSKHWADANGIKNRGDKVSDFHGNKGVSSLIVDPDMDLDEARAKGLEGPVKWFKANPGLDMVMSPYSAVSRFNGGLYREAIGSEKEDLVDPDTGKVTKDGICTLDIIVMEQTADKKSTDYTDDEEVQTSSRNFGGQTGWSLASNGALATLREGFDRNGRSVTNFREMLIATGMDLDEYGNMRIGYKPHEGEERALFGMKPLLLKTKLDRESGLRVSDMDSSTGRQKVDYQAMKMQFGQEIEQSGGIMELPFPIQFPKGKAVDESGRPVEIGATAEIPPESRSEESKAVYAGKTYGLPVMSAYLRSGQEFVDGTSLAHDYTGQYLRLYECGLKYRDAEAAGASARELSEIRAQGQQEYNRITDDIIATKFSGKRNIVRTTLLGAKQPAMTAVVTPDPRLDLEEIAINPDMGKAMGVREGGYMLTWRDPLLTRTGMSANVVRYDSEQRCIGFSPLTGESKDQDCDGDTNGAKAMKSDEAIAEAKGCLNIVERMLKTSAPPDEEGNYDLDLNLGEEHAAGLVMSPSLRDVYSDIKRKANDVERRAKHGEVSGDALALERRNVLGSLNNYVHAVLDSSYGAHSISYTDAESCFRSIESYVKDGVKGSAKKLDTFGRFMGVSYERDALGNVDYSTFRDEGMNVASEQEKLDPLDARNMQQAYTGPAGGQTIQSMVYAATATDRDFTKGLTGRRVTAAEIMDAFTSTNKQVTQGVLQVKHSASQARQMEEVLQNYLVGASAGYKLEKTVDDETGEVAWRKARDENGKYIQATPREYRNQIIDIYANGIGVAVVEEKVNIMADFLTDPATGFIKTPEQRRKEAPPLQRMAYDGAGDNGFATVQRMASEGRNLYEGSPNLNAAMAPLQVRHNQAVKARREAGFLGEFEAEELGIPEGEDKLNPLVEHRERVTAADQYAQDVVRTVESHRTRQAEPEADDERRLDGYVPTAVSDEQAGMGLGE